MKKFGKALLAYIIAEVIVTGVTCMVNNIANDKDILGRKKDPKKTKQSKWTQRIILAKEDYKVA